MFSFGTLLFLISSVGRTELHVHSNTLSQRLIFFSNHFSLRLFLPVFCHTFGKVFSRHSAIRFIVWICFWHIVFCGFVRVASDGIHLRVHTHLTRRNFRRKCLICHNFDELQQWCWHFSFLLPNPRRPIRLLWLLFPINKCPIENCLCIDLEIQPIRFKSIGSVFSVFLCWEHSLFRNFVFDLNGCIWVPVFVRLIHGFNVNDDHHPLLLHTQNKNSLRFIEHVSCFARNH